MNGILHADVDSDAVHGRGAGLPAKTDDSDLDESRFGLADIVGVLLYPVDKNDVIRLNGSPIDKNRCPPSGPADFNTIPSVINRCPDRRFGDA